MNLCTYESVICSIQKQPGPFDFDEVLEELVQQFSGEKEDSLRSILSQVWMHKNKSWNNPEDNFVAKCWYLIENRVKRVTAGWQLFEIRLIENVLRQSNIQKFQLKLQTRWIST